MSKTQKRLKLICLSAMMAAIFVVLDYFSDAVSLPLGNHKISFNGLPILIVSIFGGPVWGAVTGLVGSFISQLRWGLEAMTALWILPEVARGFLMGIIFVALKRRTKPWSLGIGVVTSSVAVTLLNTLALIVNYYVYGVGKGLYVLLVVELPTRLLLGILTAVLMTVVLSIITPPLKKVIRL
ncbi:MAG: ECF transporter S component [Clostridia bacterium]|nr:ECF transporter S component [Clostridia bacterium]